MTGGGPRRAERIVVKVGSSSLATRDGVLDLPALQRLVDQLAAARTAGHQVVLVSSGAIAAGLGPLGLSRRPLDLATLQAAASVGQLALCHAYAAAFSGHGIAVGQVLLTAEDVERRVHYRNARTTLRRLLDLGVLPVVNENDAVATEEIRFGDNDRLAALVAHLVDADRLLLLSDVDAVYDRAPHLDGATPLRTVRSDDDLRGVDTAGGGSGLGRGGMASKIQAARLAAGTGVDVVIGSAAWLGALLTGAADQGTVFPATAPPSASRLRWLAHASAPRGALHLDAGAVRALRRRASLLPAGVRSATGDFSPGDPVELVGPDGMLVGRGLVGYASRELPALLGTSLRQTGGRELVHADDLVLYAAGDGGAAAAGAPTAGGAAARLADAPSERAEPAVPS